MKKLGLALAFLLSSFLIVSCGEGNASSKIKKDKLEDAKKRDAEISLGAPVVSFDKSQIFEKM